MKRIVAVLLLMSFALCGCSSKTSSFRETDIIETLKGWSFQYNSGTDDYSVFFGLLNDKGQYISADVDVDIRITDEEGNELYKATRSVTKKDFDYYTSKITGEQFLAEIRIKASEIEEGTSTNGTVYLTVYKKGKVSFDEVNCSALYCLPVKDVSLKADGLPLEIPIKGFGGETEAIIKVEDVEYEFDKGTTSWLKITVFGVKTYGTGKSIYDQIDYKIVDSSGYVVDSGTLFLSSLNEGDKFKDDSITFYDAKPGESYTISFSESSW